MQTRRGQRKVRAHVCRAACAAILGEGPRFRPPSHARPCAHSQSPPPLSSHRQVNVADIPGRFIAHSNLGLAYQVRARGRSSET
eukprot:scaffold3317_cov51-Isochrysis_galbana.AAC.1